MTLKLINTAHGRMFVLPNDRYVGKALIEYGVYSPNEIALWKQLIGEGAIVYDCGANQGAHTLALAKIVGPSGRVVAVEPQRALASIILADAFLNQAFNIVVMPIGLASQPGTMELSHLTYSEEEANYGVVELERLRRDPSNQSYDVVEIRTLDSIASEVGPPTLIKLDVEGMEEDALRGATRILSEAKPWLWVECDRFDKNPSLLAFLQEYGYRAWWTVLPQYSQEVGSGVVTFNFLCAPPGHSVDGLGEEATPSNCECPIKVVYDNA